MDGPGIVECRDVDPFRCLISFEYAEIKEEAVSRLSLISVFNEVRHHWGNVWSFSRRVWVEVMGLPTTVWSEETFRTIAEVWGKYVYADDRTEQSWSFSVARFLIDSFEWEWIHEWITIKVEEKEYEIFVKEFGSEVYSRESHPNKLEASSGSKTAEDGKSVSWVGEMPLVKSALIPAPEFDGENLNLQKMAHCVNSEMHEVGINVGIHEGGGGGRESRREEEMAGSQTDNKGVGNENTNWALEEGGLLDNQA
ncbi:hypothetical protein PIB30_033080 [Stylosanthes scabra]|uniref:DUF4283 domain-containing protein n=1 Tax=Stylosanthes scabra TaxID=79078 RepID=A0ABU6QDQ1_9FABA|nr:hypothetical protein [Stylosanthes scabra]